MSQRTELNRTSASLVAASRAVVQSLAAEEAKRKERMSDVLKSVYRKVDAPKRKETFTTGNIY